MKQRGFAHLLLLLILIVGLAGGVYLVQQKTNLFSKAFNPDESIEKLTAQLIDFKDQSKGRGAQSLESQQKMIEVAIKRQSKLAAELETNPNSFFEKATLYSSVKDFPSVVQPFIEQEKDLEGTLEIDHLDGFKETAAKNEYYLKQNDGEEYSLHFSNTAPNVFSGSKVSLKGVAISNKVGLRSTSSTDKFNLRVTQEAAHPLSTGNQKIAVVPVNIDTLTPSKKEESNPLNALRKAAGGGSPSSSDFKIISPNGGEEYSWDQTITISWNDTRHDLTYVYAYLQDDSGDPSHQYYIKSALPDEAPNNTMTFSPKTIVPPGQTSTRYKIQLGAYILSSGNHISSISENYFTIGLRPTPTPRPTATPIPSPTPNPALRHLTVPVTNSELNRLILDRSNSRSLVSFYEANSFGQANFSGDVLPDVTINTSLTSCPNNTWSDMVDNILIYQKGVDLNKYQKIIYVFPNLMEVCAPYGGRGSMGELQGRSWIWDNQSNPDYYIHEFGHNLGLDHANKLDCKGKSVANYKDCRDSNPYPNTEQGFGRGIEYGDYFDVMGYNRLFHLNPVEKVQLGWIPSRAITQIGSDRIVTIKPPISRSGNLDPQVVKISKPDTNEYYYLGYRQNEDLDQELPKDFTSGASIYISNDNTKDVFYPSKLVDTNPLIKGLEDAPLSDGRYFYDQINRILIRQISHNSDSVTLDIKFNQDEPVPTPTLGQPTLTPTPEPTKAPETGVHSWNINVKVECDEGLTQHTTALYTVWPPNPLNWNEDKTVGGHFLHIEAKNSSAVSNVYLELDTEDGTALTLNTSNLPDKAFKFGQFFNPPTYMVKWNKDELPGGTHTLVFNKTFGTSKACK